jgi:hypothetical protein
MASRAGTKNLTPEQRAQLLQMVTMGQRPSEAAQRIGVSPQAISMRKKRDAAFAADVQSAEAGLELGLLAQVRLGAQKDWRAAAWLLERRFPDRWARPEVRGDLAVVNVDTEQLARAIQAGLAAVAKRHAPFDEPDIDAASAAAQRPPDDLGSVPKVTRS